jgi:serine/threonine protein kinase
MMVEDFVKEAQTMMKFRDPNLLQLLGVCTTEEPIFIVTELMQHGSLLNYLRKDEEKHIKVPDMVNMTSQIAKGNKLYLCVHLSVHNRRSTK